MTTQTEIRAMVASARSGGVLRSGLVQSGDDPLELLHLAVVRYTLGLGPGDVEAEYAEVVKAMAA